MVQAAPSVQVWELTVVAACTKPVFAIDELVMCDPFTTVGAAAVPPRSVLISMPPIATLVALGISEASSRPLASCGMLEPDDPTVYVKVPGAEPEVALPNSVNAPAFDAENESAGVLVDVATLVVNSGDRLPALKFVTDPPVPLQLVNAHAEPVHSKQPVVKVGMTLPDK